MSSTVTWLSGSFIVLLLTVTKLPHLNALSLTACCYVRLCLLNCMICFGFQDNDNDLSAFAHTTMHANGGFKDWYWAKEEQYLLTWGLSQILKDNTIVGLPYITQIPIRYF